MQNLTKANEARQQKHWIKYIVLKKVSQHLKNELTRGNNGIYSL